MKKFVTAVTVIFGLLLIWKLGLAFGGLALVLTVLLGMVVKHRYDYVGRLKAYAERYENVYVVSRHPDTEEEIPLKGLDSLIVWANYDRVMLAVAEEEAWLTRAGNSFFTDPNLKQENRLKVIPIIFQDGAFVNENWKGFRHRVRETIEADRVVVHSTLKEASPGWYMKFSNGQTDFQWERK